MLRPLGRRRGIDGFWSRARIPLRQPLQGGREPRGTERLPAARVKFLTGADRGRVVARGLRHCVQRVRGHC